MSIDPKAGWERQKQSIFARRSRPLDQTTFTYAEQAQPFFSDLYSRLAEKTSVKLPLSEKRYWQHYNTLVSVVMDLYHRHVTTDGKGTVAISLNNNSYHSSSRYNKLGISRTTIGNVTKALRQAGYIWRQKGYRNDKAGKMSRFFAHPRLIEELCMWGFTPDDIEEINDVEVIELGDNVKIKGKMNKRHIDLEYEDTEETSAMRQEVLAYREFLKQFDIQCTSWREYTRKDAYKMKRGFIRDFNLGGRLYAGFWQYMPSEHRKDITIDGVPTVEYDYRNCQLKITYALEGVFYEEDAYMVEGLSDPLGRSALKATSLICLNTVDNKQAVQALTSKLREISGVYDYLKVKKMNAKSLIDIFMEKHKRIESWFFGQSGLKLQRIDSEICMNIINEMMSRNIPVLTIHDSFIVQTSFEHELMQVMVNQWQKHLEVDAISRGALLKKN